MRLPLSRCVVPAEGSGGAVRLAATLGWAGAKVAVAHGGNGFTKEYGIYDLYGLVRLLRTAPLNREMVLNYIAEHVMGLPRSY